MRTPTAIEIVRELVTYRGMRFNDKTQSCITTALASVLRDAERFAALERAHDNSGRFGWARFSEFDEAVSMDEPLAELADRLREGSQ